MDRDGHETFEEMVGPIGSVLERLWLMAARHASQQLDGLKVLAAKRLLSRCRSAVRCPPGRRHLARGLRTQPRSTADLHAGRRRASTQLNRGNRPSPGLAARRVPADAELDARAAARRRKAWPGSRLVPRELPAPRIDFFFAIRKRSVVWSPLWEEPRSSPTTI